jgi:hypothetical protein
MRRMLALAVTLGLAAAASGCGGSSKESAPETTATTAPAGTTGTSGGASSTPSFASAHNCAQLASLAAQVAKSLQVQTGGVQATVENENKVLQAMANAAPSEIRGDFQTFADAFHSYIEAIANLKLKAGTVPSAAQIAQLTNAAKKLDTPKLRRAEKHLSTWASKNCGGVAPTTTG